MKISFLFLFIIKNKFNIIIMENKYTKDMKWKWVSLDKDNIEGEDCVNNCCSCSGHFTNCSGYIVPKGNRSPPSAVAKKIYFGGSHKTS